MKNRYINAGCNGAGKTTASFTIFPQILDCKEYVNADEIARGLSPFQPDKVAIEAGRIMLKRIEYLLNGKDSFAFETTLASSTYRHTIEKAQIKGFRVILLFLWLRHVELAIERVRVREGEGGHNIEKEVIKRRYLRGIQNLFQIYLPLADEVLVFDNSDIKHELIAEKLKDEEIGIVDYEKYKQLSTYKNENS